MSAPYYQDEHLTLHHGDALRRRDYRLQQPGLDLGGIA